MRNKTLTTRLVVLATLLLLVAVTLFALVQN